jgi:hypothetical protein
LLGSAPGSSKAAVLAGAIGWFEQGHLWFHAHDASDNSTTTSTPKPDVSCHLHRQPKDSALVRVRRAQPSLWRHEIPSPISRAAATCADLGFRLRFRCAPMVT